MEEVSKAIGRSMGRPSWLPVPEFALKLALGEMAEEMLLASARALPKRLLEAGFSFAFPDLESALDNLLGKD
jgi:NAD dependent epimerase/dehydratase family enzyme